MSDNVKQISYDELSVTINSNPLTHPNRLAVLGMFFGMSPAPVDRCRVLDLGCAQGGNLIPMAFNLPYSEFVGIDLSSKQIAAGQKVIEELGIKNITLKQEDILNFSENEGKFDYIIADGIFSWVPKKVQDKLFNICQHHLNPQGIAYINYSTYPGWRIYGLLRDIMAYHSAGISDPGTIAKQSREVIAFLSDAVDSEKNPYGKLLKKESENLMKHSDYYIIRVFLEGNNEPFYFHEFSRKANKNGLQYLGESPFQNMLSIDFAPKVQEALNKITNNLIAREQYMDFLRNRTHRNTLLCHSNLKLNRTINVDIINNLFVTTLLKPDSDRTGSDDGKEDTYIGRNGVKVSFSNIFGKTYFKYLSDIAPQVIKHKDAFKITLKIISDKTGKKISDAEKATFSNLLFNSFANGIINFYALGIKVVNKVSNFPKVSLLVRFQARAGLKVTSQNHISLNVELIHQKIVQLLDGKNDLKTIKEKLLVLAETGELVFNHDNEIVSDRVQIEKIIDEILDAFLNRLAEHSFLIG